MRETLKAEIKKYTQSEVAEFIGTSSPTITKFLNGTQEVSLSTVLELVRYLKPEMEKKMMIHFIKEVKKPSNIIIAMEYASTNRLIKTLTYLLKKFQDTSNHELKEYLSIYEIILDWQMSISKLSLDEQILRVRKLKVTTPEGNVLVKLLEVYGYYCKDKFNLAYDLANDLLVIMEELESDYLKKSFSARLKETNSYLSLIILNDKEQAIKCALSTIKSKIGSAYTAMAHYVIGTACMYDDYEKSKLHFEKAIKIYDKQEDKYNVNEVRKELEYASAYHNANYEYKNPILKAYTSHSSQIGSDSILNDSDTNTLSGLDLMFLGRLKHDKQLLIQSFTKFIQEKNMFNANKVKETLQEMEVDTMILDNLMNIFA